MKLKIKLKNKIIKRNLIYQMIKLIKFYFNLNIIYINNLLIKIKING